MNVFNIISVLRPALEILILWFVIYHIILFFEGTRAIHVLRGIVILLAAFFLFQQLRLDILGWLLTKLFAISVIVILVIFHPEIRQGLARLGQRNLFSAGLREHEIDRMLKEIAKAVESLMHDRIGALIAIEKSEPLSAYIKTGVAIDGRLSSELIQAVFTPNNPLHDGGMVIQQGRIAAAGCLFPLTDNQDLNRIFGTRHRAALGLSEEADAIIIIVSEERQDVSLVYRGKLYRSLSREGLIAQAKEMIKITNPNV